MRKFLEFIRFLGPAFIVSVAYVDPGNFATNISGGTKYGYSLLWVILYSNIIAIFLQIMSAKVGIATGKNIPQLCRENFAKKTNFIFLCFGELAAIATDLAEFLGGSLGLYLLFNIPLWAACIIVCIITFLICSAEKYGQRKVEYIITAFIFIVGLSYLFQLFLARPDMGTAVKNTLIPSIFNVDALVIAVGMLGATVMPHVIYLHSDLVQNRKGEKRKKLFLEKIDILVAMNIAFFVNAAMVIVSADVFFSSGIVVETIEQAHSSLSPILGQWSSVFFGVALLASGLSSSAVGTMAGGTILGGFMGYSIPLYIRRLITMLPALIIILCGVNPMNALVISQVALSFILPIPIFQMLYLAGKKEIMGEFANSRRIKIIGFILALIICIFNLMLIIFTFSGGMK